MDRTNKFNLRTDLAYDVYMETSKEKIEGFEEIKRKINGLNVYEHKVSSKASFQINKAEGIYYTIDLNNVNYHDTKVSRKIEDTVSLIIKEMLSKYNLIGKKCLIVGLGNDSVTPDSIGPYVVDNVIVTRHLDLMDDLSEGYSVVSAITPGVMGETGIETYDIIEAIRKKIDIDYIIVVDALASSSIERVNKTIQFTDSGIQPGSGVGNKRKELSCNTLRLPVFAIGIPTVVDAVTIVNDTLDYTMKVLCDDYKNEVNKYMPDIAIKEKMLGKIGLLTEEDRRDLFMNILTPNGFNLMVTSRNIDEEVEDLSKIVAWGINKSLHSSINLIV